MLYNFIFNQICITLEKHSVFYIVVNNIITVHTKQLEIYLDCFLRCNIKIQKQNRIFSFI